MFLAMIHSHLSRSTCADLHNNHPFRGLMRKLILMMLLSLAATPVMAQGFTCSVGRPSCLGYGDKVVDQNAVCFNGGTCGYGSFVCKSKLDDVVSEYDRMVSTYNELVRKTRGLVEAAQEIVRKNGTLTSDYDELLDRHKRLSADLDDKTEQLRVMTESDNLLRAVTARPGGTRPKDAAAKKGG